MLKETEPRGGEASRRDQSEFCAERVGGVGHGGDRIDEGSLVFGNRRSLKV